LLFSLLSPAFTAIDEVNDAQDQVDKREEKLSVIGMKTVVQ